MILNVVAVSLQLASNPQHFELNVQQLMKQIHTLKCNDSLGYLILLITEYCQFTF